jgi:hypothetical protein
LLSSTTRSTTPSTPFYQSPTLESDVSQEIGVLQSTDLNCDLPCRASVDKIGFFALSITPPSKQTATIIDKLFFPAGQYDLKYPGYEGISYDFHGVLNKCYGRQDYMDIEWIPTIQHFRPTRSELSGCERSKGYGYRRVGMVDTSCFCVFRPCLHVYYLEVRNEIDNKQDHIYIYQHLLSRDIG